MNFYILENSSSEFSIFLMFDLIFIDFHFFLAFKCIYIFTAFICKKKLRSKIVHEILIVSNICKVIDTAGAILF